MSVWEGHACLTDPDLRLAEVAPRSTRELTAMRRTRWNPYEVAPIVIALVLPLLITLAAMSLMLMKP
ncbi:MAG TPA: hypothetical protein VFU47_17125 [Armatimonadota bacterium]|nr:hypothetical protein [Armatimonadota bacterium]